jgi:hypothetical protein
MNGGNLPFDLPQTGGHSGGPSRAFPPKCCHIVRDKFMVLLTERRTVREIAVGMNRTPSNVTGHLHSMRQKNLVVVSAGACGSAATPARTRQITPASDTITPPRNGC